MYYLIFERSVNRYTFGIRTVITHSVKNANANDIAYWKFLVDEAEQLFNERVNKLEQVYMNR